ncbi:hypothetical protein [Mucilaginibacter aquatilis]|uniref:Uncharacterized protein n=1 Tax=Mucilaginibacter aquatilis TaxID=1517760 RepID=A0A6I4IBM6_9SPHI|nr:hypothetical protein [Mucilaginibacter aquatilis]MVN92591.1 hypothetical protein [Mucilaginibacter aquatilis]
MRKLALVVFAVLSVIIGSCRKDSKPIEKQDFYFTANKNNESWVAQFVAFGENGAKNYVLVGNKLEEHFRINITTNSLNQYVVIAPKTEFIITVGQDAVVARYILDEDATNKVNVTSYDTTKVIMKGNFNIYLKKVTGDNNYPATINFSSGNFKLTKAYD